MDFATRMMSLLSDLRRERNGLAADTMKVAGRPCGLNLGVSLPTIKSIACAQPCDHDFACSLYRQDVRELKIAALCIADPSQVDADTVMFWLGGACNSELAEMAALLLLSRASCAGVLTGERYMYDELSCYAVLMSSARSEAVTVAGVLTAAERALAMYPDSKYVARGAVAAVVSASRRDNAAARVFVERMRGKPDTASVRMFVDEAEWQIPG